MFCFPWLACPEKEVLYWFVTGMGGWVDGWMDTDRREADDLLGSVSVKMSLAANKKAW